MEPTTPTSSPLNQPHHRGRQPKTRGRRIADYAVTVTGNLVLLYVFNSLLDWHAQLITAHWADVLPLLNASVLATVACNLTFIFYDERRFYLLARIALDLVAIAVLYQLWVVFPFDFGGFFGMAWLNPVVKIVLPLGILGTIVGSAVRVFRFVRGTEIYY
ncbi:MAG: hypothetical protein V1916_03535 [Patescibacteria group bacterium]